MAKKPKLIKKVAEVVNPAVRHVADRLHMLTGSRDGVEDRKPRIDKFYETGLVVAIFEYLLMLPSLAHLEICHEKPYPKKTKPEQVDIWIRSLKGGTDILIEAGDFTPKKLKDDASKMRRLNAKGQNWFLAFFRDQPTAKKPNAASMDPQKKLRYCRSRKSSLKGCHVALDAIDETEGNLIIGKFEIDLPDQPKIYFGYALIRVWP
ncbi:MAG: hypothetical protein DYH12_00930 [Sorangiineae bacterium PRO1]|nr:hypothetical protein [Sorangiineae bacterium PRO1]